MVLLTSFALYLNALVSFPPAIIHSGFYVSKPPGDGVVFPVTFAHRGSRNLFPQNTLFAFHSSHAMGAEVLELDVHLTKDGRVAVIHDDDLGIVANRPDLVVSHSTLEELQLVDLGHLWYFGRSPAHPYRGLGIRVPELDDVLGAFPHALINIELKVPGFLGGLIQGGFDPSTSTLAHKVCESLKKFNASHRVVVMSFSDLAWYQFRSICPQVPTAAGPLLILPHLLVPLLPVPFNAIQIPHQVATRTLVRRSQSGKVAVHVWTVNTREDMDRMAEIGVDGIMTDRLDLLLERRGSVVAHSTGERRRMVASEKDFEDMKACRQHEGTQTWFMAGGCKFVKERGWE